MKSANFDSAAILLEKITPASAMEEALSFVIPFTFSNNDSVSLIISDSDFETLYNLAFNDPKIYGSSVYIAQAILNLRVEAELYESNEEKIGFFLEKNLFYILTLPIIPSQ
ncbi:MAG: hypothetical protein IPH61_08125 [Bacteroidetes bacterium]|nr:hypothetical protein [Bacteroidota bacterium]